MHYKIRGKWLDFKYFFLPRKHYFISSAIFVVFTTLILAYGRPASSQAKGITQEYDNVRSVQQMNALIPINDTISPNTMDVKGSDDVPSDTAEEKSDLLYQLFKNDLEEGEDFLFEEDDVVDEYDGYFKQMEFQSYEIRKGDTLSQIARRYKVNSDTIISMNEIKSSKSLTIGNILVIPNMKGILHTVKKGESLKKIVLKYKEYKVRLEDIVYINEINDNSVSVGQRLFIPGAKLPKDGLVDKLKNFFAIPVAGRIVSSVGNRTDPFKFTRAYHPGVDIKARYGSPVRAARDGKVIYAGWRGGYGKLVIISHGVGLETRYGHLSSIKVKSGQWIKKKQLLGKVGSTGRSTGPHLHFEVRKNNVPQKVLRKFKGLNGTKGSYWKLN